MNKKVLLRERKRHTARHVASARGEGYLPWTGGVLTFDLAMGVPTLDGEEYLPWGTPHPDLAGGEGVPT